MQSLSLLKNEEMVTTKIKFWDTSWDFKTAYTKYSNHGFHTYPAMMIPQIARRLIETYGKNHRCRYRSAQGIGAGTARINL